MRRFLSSSSAVGAAFLVAIALTATAPLAHATAVIWDDDSTDMQWSTGTNWNPDIAGLPGVGDSVTFDGTGSSTTQGTVTNILASSTTIDSLTYALPNVDFSDSSIHHTTQLAAGTTLTVNGLFSAGIQSGGPNPGNSGLNTTTGSVTITGQSAGDGALVINAGSNNIAIGYNDSTWHNGRRYFTFDLRGLGSFHATTTGTFYLANGAQDYANLYLADTTNTITADRIALAGWNTSPTIYLGGNTTLNADSIILGGGLPGGSATGQWNNGSPSIVFRSDLTTPSVVIRDEAGTGRANLTIGIGGNTNGNNTATVDFSGGTVDALLGTVIIGQGYPSTGTGNDGIGTLTFGSGTIDATTITVGYTASGTTVDNNSTGTLNINGPGTLIVDSLIVADQQDTVNDVPTTGTVNLNAGTLLATLITGGTTSASTVRTFNWSGGTIGNKAGSDLLIDASMPLTLKTTADHTFDVEAGQTVTVDAVIAEDGAAASITKTGAGTLVLTAANSYSGGTNVLDGTLSISSDANLGDVPTSFSASLVQINGATLHASSTLDFDYNRGLTVGSSGATFDVDAGQTLTILRNANGTDPGMVVTGDVVKEGDGTLIFGDTSWTYGKTLTINDGTVICYSTDSDDGSIRGNITVNDGATYDHRTVNGIWNAALLTANTGGTILFKAGDAVGGFAGGGSLVGSTTAVIDYTGTTPVDFSGVISGSMSFNFRGNSYSNGTQIFSGDNTYTGSTTVSGGTLQIGAGGASGTLGSGAVTVNSPGTLRFYRSDNNFSITQSISGSGDLVFLGTGVTNQSGYQLDGSNAGLTGTVTVDGARLRVNDDADLGTAIVTVLDGGQLFVYGGTVSNSLTIAGTGWQESSGTLGAIRLSGNAVVSGTVALAADSSVHAHSSGETGTISGEITGGFALEKTGAGTVILSGPNTYTGGTTVSDGTLQINSLGALPGSADVAAGGTLRLLTSDTVWANTLTGDGTVEVQFSAGSGNTQLTGIGGFNGTVELTTTATTGDKWRLENVNAPNATVVVNPGTQLFVVGNNYLESVEVSGTGNSENRGGIRFSGTLNAPVVLMGDTTFGPESGSLTGAISTGVAGDHVLRIGGTATTPFGTTFTGVISDGVGTLALEVLNNNSGLTFIPGSSLNTYSGGTTLLGSSGGTRLRIDGISGTPYGTGAVTIGQAATDKAGIFFTTSNQTLTNDIVVNTALGTDRPGIRADATSITLSGTLTANLADATFSTNSTGSFNLTGQVTGASGITLHNQYGSSVTVTLNNTTANPNDYQGDTTIAGTKGTLALGAANQVPNGSTAGNLVNNGTFRMNGYDETINGLSGSGTVDGGSGTPTFTVGDNDADATFSGTITDSSGTLSLVKIGAGTQILSGSNTYGGTTLVGQGALLVNGTHTGGDLYVVNGTGTLGGSGTIGSEVTVYDGGTLAPGNSPGILTLEDGVTFYGGTFAVELNGTTAGTEYDQLLVTGGDVALGDGVTSLVVTTSGFSLDIDDFFWIINNTSTTDGNTTGYFQGLEEASSMMVDGRRVYVYYHADYDTGSFIGGNDVLLTSVPEPSTLAMLMGLAMLGLLGYRRRRR